MKLSAPNHRLELTAALRENVRPRSLSGALDRSDKGRRKGLYT